MNTSRMLIALGTIAAGVACLLSVLVGADDATVDAALIWALGFGGATAIGAGVLLR